MARISFSFYVIIQTVSQTGPHFYADNKLSQGSDPLKALCWIWVFVYWWSQVLASPDHWWDCGLAAVLQIIQFVKRIVKGENLGTHSSVGHGLSRVTSWGFPFLFRHLLEPRFSWLSLTDGLLKLSQIRPVEQGQVVFNKVGLVNMAFSSRKVTTWKICSFVPYFLSPISNIWIIY